MKDPQSSSSTIEQGAARKAAGRGWVLCIDFGTAASKAAIGNQAEWMHAGRWVRPLPIGHYAGNADPLLAPSALYVDGGRIYFGPAALKRAHAGDADREPLQSFKMLLGAADLPELLKMSVKRTIDPAGRFSNRDILTLYIAYLSALIAACFAADESLAAIRDQVRWRYSRPEWPGSKTGINDRVTKVMFEAGIHTGIEHKDEFLSHDGVDIETALKLVRAPAPDAGALVEGSVFEAHAAGAAHAGSEKLYSPVVMVFDMGAGTTDFDGFKIVRIPSGELKMTGIAGARRSIAQAGDEVDKILMNAVIDRANVQKNVKTQNALWRSMSSTIRDIKRQAFLQDKCAVNFQNKTIVLTRAQLEKSQDFKDFVKVIEKHFEASLTVVAAAAKAEKVKKVSLILAGGGAALPFVQKMAQNAEKNWHKDARVVLEPLAPSWAHGPDFSSGLAALFPQLEVSLGGTSPLISAGASQ